MATTEFKSGRIDGTRFRFDRSIELRCRPREPRGTVHWYVVTCREHVRVTNVIVRTDDHAPHVAKRRKLFINSWCVDRVDEPHTAVLPDHSVTRPVTSFVRMCEPPDPTVPSIDDLVL
ncbi:hypothetical protein FK85_14360 [Halorubrum saccharovorum]|uniref:Uncharacterized protein n=1 Tax=Halorubrum saccharovorum TaxID=2248 RepID=A0A081EXY3_9EURY|nr:hypothetical protein FK85_14360 [Halorubrum saccharovorum]